MSEEPAPEPGAGDDEVEHAAWCAEDKHNYELAKCVSRAVEIGKRRPWVWLEHGEEAAAAPVLVVDTPLNGADLSLTESEELCDALKYLRQLAEGGLHSRDDIRPV